MATVAQRPRAELDVLDTSDRVAEDSFSVAIRWADRLDAAPGPAAADGRARPELASELRSMPFERYVIFNVPLRDGVDVVRMMHSARHIDESS